MACPSCVHWINAPCRARTDPTDWMWAQACELIDQAERMHRQFFRLAARRRGARPSWEPPVDVFEDEREIVDRRRAARRAGRARRGHRRSRARWSCARERPLPFAGARRRRAAAGDSLRRTSSGASRCPRVRLEGRHARTDRRLPDRCGCARADRGTHERETNRTAAAPSRADAGSAPSTPRRRRAGAARRLRRARCPTTR